MSTVMVQTRDLLVWLAVNLGLTPADKRMELLSLMSKLADIESENRRLRQFGDRGRRRLRKAAIASSSVWSSTARCASTTRDRTSPSSCWRAAASRPPKAALSALADVLGFGSLVEKSATTSQLDESTPAGRSSSQGDSSSSLHSRAWYKGGQLAEWNRRAKLAREPYDAMVALLDLSALELAERAEPPRGGSSEGGGVGDLSAPARADDGQPGRPAANHEAVRQLIFFARSTTRGSSSLRASR